MRYCSLKPIADREDFEHFESAFLTKPQVVLIIGKRRSGKTALALRMIENKIEKTKLRAYSIRFPESLPSPIENLTSIESAKPDTINFVDEIGILYPAKRHMNQLSLGEVLYLAGQKNITLIATTQYAISADLNILRNIDILIIKEPSLMQIATERPILGKFLRNAKECFDMFPELERRKFGYVMSDHFKGMIEFELPSFWSNDISYAFKNYKIG